MVREYLVLLLQVQLFVLVIGIHIDCILQLRDALARQRGLVEHSGPSQQQAIAGHDVLILSATCITETAEGRLGALCKRG